MSVYYIHSPETGLVKIGYAKDAKSRLCKMQVDSPTRLILLAVEDGDKAAEAERHRRFAHLRVRGEWFNLSGELADYLASLPVWQPPARQPRVTGPLGAWLDRNGHTLVTFAAVVGSSHATLSRICAGKNYPSRSLMLRIYEATGREVDANAICGLPLKNRAL